MCGIIYLYVTYMANQLLTASEFARVCQVTPRTIRWYQKQGILKPVKIDKWNKYAYFDPQQALKVFRIKLLQQFNLPLREIKTLINKKNLTLDEELKELDNLIKEKQKDLQFLKQINNILSPNSSPVIKSEIIGTFQLFCFKVNNGDYHKVDEYLNNLRNSAKELKLKQLDTELTFYLDEDFEYRPKQSNLEIALIIKKIPEKTFALEKNYYFRKFPKTKTLTFTFKGPYNYLPLVYKKIDKYIIDQKIKLTGPVFEIYLKNPMNTKSSYDYVTKICYPIS